MASQIEHLSPHQQIPIDDKGGKVTLEWYRFFENIKVRQDQNDELISSLTAQLSDSAQTVEDLQSMVEHLSMGASNAVDPPAAAMSDAPIGCILPFGGTYAPGGYLDCNGDAVSRTTYAELFDAIGVAFGVGDGSSTFNVPDLPGKFLHGSGGGTGIHIGDTVTFGAVGTTYTWVAFRFIIRYA